MNRSSPANILPEHRPGRQNAWIVVVAITFAVWAPIIWNDFVDWDDLEMIVHNPRFNPPTWAATGWYWIHPAWNLYQPLTTTLWAVLARIGWVDVPDQFGGHMNPAVFHLAAVLLQTATSLILFGILRRTFKTDAAAIIGALLFAIHPIQVEAVAFSGAINNPLAGLLGLLAIGQYLVATDPTVPAPKRKKLWIIGSIALLLSMLAKPTAVVIPPLALALDLAIHRGPPRKAFWSIGPWVLLVLPCVIWTRLIQHGIEASHSPLWYRPVIASDAVMFYLCKIIWPIPLCIDYGRSPQFVQLRGFEWMTLLVPLGMIALAISIARRTPLLAAAILIFLIALLPNSGLVPFDSQVVSTVSDRYAYLAMFGVAVAVAFAVAKYPKAIHVFILLLIVLVIITQMQIATWRNGETLFRQALAVNPNSSMADNNLAVVIADRSPDEAIALCRRAIAVRSDHPYAWNSLGSLLMAKGDRTHAIDAFRHACQLSPETPVYASNLARAIKETASPATAP